MPPRFASRSRGSDYNPDEIITLLEWLAAAHEDSITLAACEQGKVICAIGAGAASLRLPHWSLLDPTLVLEFHPNHVWARWDDDPLKGQSYEMLWEALQGELYGV